MTERPIDFRRHEVIATLAGRQTQFRRPITRARVFGTPESKAFTLTGPKLARALQNADRFRRMDGDGWFWEADAFEWQAPSTRTGWLAHIGFAPGERLWVCELWRVTKALDEVAPKDLDHATIPEWLATDPVLYEGRTRPPMHLPRWASRITLEVTGVKVERLQDISEEDSLAEGVVNFPPGSAFYGVEVERNDFGQVQQSAREAYGWLWDRINGPASWDANPWVIATTFRRVSP